MSDRGNNCVFLGGEPCDRLADFRARLAEAERERDEAREFEARAEAMLESAQEEMTAAKEEVRDAALELAQLQTMFEKQAMNISEHRWEDMTPDEGLPARLLAAYLDYSVWTDNTLGIGPDNPIIIEMNRARHERNAILERAIERLNS